MKRFYEANASETPPKPPVNPSYGYPQNGNRSLNQKPTKLGAYWFHMITEEFMAVIEGAGLEPSETNLHQLADIFADFRDRASGAETFKEAAEAAAKLAEDFAKLAEEAAKNAVSGADEKIKEIQAEGQKQVTTVTNTGVAQVKAVEASGATQTANAKAQADSAAKSAQTASNGATTATAKATEATTQATKAKAWASQTGSAVEGGFYSALHYATHAESQAKKAETGATTATTKATEATNKAKEAETSAATAVAKATEATNKATEASNSAKAAAESAKVSAFAVRITSVNMSASGTAALSSLTPQTNVKVGDTVIDPEGEVFSITAITSTTFTVGAKLTSIKGPQGSPGTSDYNQLQNKPDLSGYATKTELTEGLSSKQPAGDYALKSEIPPVVDASKLVPKSGSRGALAGSETPGSGTTVNDTSPDTMTASGNITVANGTAGTAWTKAVTMTSVLTVTLGSSWHWAGGKAPTIKAPALLVCHWNGTVGIANITNGAA